MQVSVLSIRQPGASLILYSSKWCENRTWACPEKLWGKRLYIHASSWDSGMSDVPKNNPHIPFPTGMIIGSVLVHGSWPVDDVNDAEGEVSPIADLEAALKSIAMFPKSFRGWPFVHGPHCWLLSNPQPLDTPVPAKGKLNVWSMELSDAD